MKKFIVFCSAIFLLNACEKGPKKTFWIQNNSHIPIRIVDDKSIFGDMYIIEDGQCIQVNKSDLPLKVTIIDSPTCGCAGCDYKEVGTISKEETTKRHYIWNGQSAAPVAESDIESFMNACKNWKEVLWIRNSSAVPVSIAGKNVESGQCIAVEKFEFQELSLRGISVTFTDQTLKPEDKLPWWVSWDEEKSTFYGKWRHHSPDVHREWRGWQHPPQTFSSQNEDFVKACKNGEPTWHNTHVEDGCAPILDEQM